MPCTSRYGRGTNMLDVLVLVWKKKREATFLVVCMLRSISVLRALPSGHLSSDDNDNVDNDGQHSKAQTTRMFNILFISSFVRASPANFWWRFADTTNDDLLHFDHMEMRGKKDDSCGILLENLQTKLLNLNTPRPWPVYGDSENSKRIKFQWDAPSDCLRFRTLLPTCQFPDCFPTVYDFWQSLRTAPESNRFCCNY